MDIKDLAALEELILLQMDCRRDMSVKDKVVVLYTALQSVIVDTNNPASVEICKSMEIDMDNPDIDKVMDLAKTVLIVGLQSIVGGGSGADA